MIDRDREKQHDLYTTYLLINRKDYSYFTLYSTGSCKSLMWRCMFQDGVSECGFVNTVM